MKKSYHHRGGLFASVDVKATLQKHQNKPPLLLPAFVSDIEESRPPPISNINLINLQKFNLFTLKEDLIEHHDYEAVLPKVWQHLVSWYSFTDNEPILRPVRYDQKQNRHYVDLYLEYHHNNQHQEQ